jgi:hypothetical protein
MTDYQRNAPFEPEIVASSDQAFTFTPPCLYGESEETQRGYFTEIFVEIKPQCFLEDEWTLDIFDFTWTCWRLRHLKVALLNAAAYRGLEKLLVPLIGPNDAGTLAKNWNLCDQAAVEKVNELLASANLSMEAVMAETLSLRLLEVERIDRMIADALAGRAATFREIERHRTALARQLRQAIGKVEDAEFKEISAPAGGSKAA